MAVLFHLLLGFICAALVALISIKFRFLTLDGAVAAVMSGTIVFGLGGLRWAMPLLVFFFTSSLLSKISKVSENGSVFEKTSTRDAWQVFANGGVGVLLAALWFFASNETFYLAYLGSLAAVTADTWGTELGITLKGRAFLVTKFHSVPHGTSGAVSLGGTLAGIFGAFIIALSGWRWIGQMEWWYPFMLVIAGVIGSAVDSLLGATFQAQYKCEICGRIVEHPMHCNTPARLSNGYRWLTNDWVNGACATTGAVTTFLL